MKNAILLLVLLISIPAYATIRGNNIYPLCEHTRDKAKPNDFKDKSALRVPMERGYIMGFCEGVIFTSFQAIHGIGYIWKEDGDFMRCMENYYGLADIDVNQILDMTMKYLKEHPENRNVEINVLMALMLHENYPESVCLKNVNKK